MVNIDVTSLDFRDLNEKLRQIPDDEIVIENCMGQRYIADGMSGKKIEITGTPGNALGAYLNGCKIILNGNAQDATGDTMNEGKIIIHGSSGDAAGYAMRGGIILVEGNVGYRAGIHMKAYEEKLPVLVVGGKAGSFLGEYQAGGIIVILGEGCQEGKAPVGNFCGTGMHGGKIFLRTKTLPSDLPSQVEARKATEEDLSQIEEYINEFSQEFLKDKTQIISGDFYVLSANSKNPYKQMYVCN